MNIKKLLTLSFAVCIFVTAIVVLSSCSFMDMLAGANTHEHELTIVEAKDATCSESGMKQHYVCSGCKGIFADELGFVALKDGDLAIAPLGHQWGSASCTDPRKCAACGATDGEPINHVAGDAVRENEVAGTCTEEGYYDSVTYCELCEKEIGRETVKTEKADHIPGEVVKENEIPATCTESGSYDNAVYCSVCKTYKFSSETVTVGATGHIDGNSDKQCDICKKEIACTNHNPVVDSAVPATCTSDGLTEGSHCSLCNATIVAQQVIPALGHSYEYTTEGALVYGVADGTCSGLTLTESCSACGESKEITDYTVNLADGTISYGEKTLPVAITLNYVGGEHTLSSGTYAGIIVEGATLTINGKVTVNGNITTSDSWLVIKDGAILNVVNGSLTTTGATVDDASYESGKHYRLTVLGTLNIDGDNGANGLLVSNSFVFGSDKDNVKANVNIKCGNGNAIQTDGASIIWWNFLNCNVNIEGIMNDGVSTSKAMYFFKNNDKHVDFMPNAKVTVKNCNDFIHTEGKWLYMALHKDAVVFENTVNAVRCSYRVRIYSQQVVVVENYEHDGKTGTAYVKLHGNFIIGNVLYDDPGPSDFSFVDFPTSEDYTTWTKDKEFIGWVE